MENDHIDRLYSSAFHGDVVARNTLISLAGRNVCTDGDVFVALSILKGDDTRAVIVKHAKSGNVEAICSYGTILVENASSNKQLIKGLCWLEEAANKGCSRAFGYLSSLHKYGDYGVSKDLTLSIAYAVKAYYAGSKAAAHAVAQMLYERLGISAGMLGDAVDWCRICISQTTKCDAMWQMEDIQRKYGIERLETAPRAIPKDFAVCRFEHYIAQYGHPRFGLFDR